MRILLTLTLLIVHQFGFSCTGGTTNGGTLTPNAGYQTIATMDGSYYSINVVCGNQYNFDFCANGGSVSGLWPEISILNSAGTIQYAFSGYVNSCSVLNWTASFTGTIRLLITDSGCNQSQSYNGVMAYNRVVGTVSSAFNMTVACGGGISTVTGTPGGTFAFNPAPGDGAQVNAATGVVSNGTAGTTYSVRYTVCGSSTTRTVTVVDEDCFTLNGSGQYINVAGEQCIQLTSETSNQTGCAWSGSQIDFNSNFSLSLDYYFGDNINGADGNTFTFQPSSSTACGQPGGQLGAGGIANALSIEFDTYDNDNPSHIYDRSCDHIAIEIDGDMQNNAPYCGPVCAKAGGGNIDDGGVYEVEIAWNATTQNLEVYFNGALRLTCNGDFVNTVFGGQNLVYWGATSATGGLNNQQYFCPSTVVVLPVELGAFTNRCEDMFEIFEWTTVSENRVDYFQLEYTYDGLIFYPLERIEAVGNSTTPISYQTKIESLNSKQRYFRLKIVDENESIEHTDIIAGKNCGNKNELIDFVKQSESTLIIEGNDYLELKLMNQIGQIVFESNVYNKEILINTKSFATGIYYIQVQDELGRQQMKKVYISN